MIIRRKHTANFTTIGNALFNDERLDLDVMGILAYLRSKPEDWEVKPVQLRKRFRLGRDSMRRIMRSAIRFGWVVARVTRLSNGTVSVIYEVRDEAGPTLTEDEARAALSLVSSGAGVGESAEGEGADDGTEQDMSGSEPGIAEGADPPGTAGGQPPTGQPGAADRLRQTHPGVERVLLKTDSVKTESPNGARAFSEVKALWPSDHVASAFACEKHHAELPDDMQDSAFNGVRPYLDDCKAQSRKVCDLATYYRERRWERFQKIRPVPGTSQPSLVRPGTPQWHRWRDYRVKTGQSVKLMDDWARQGREMTMPSQWPPALPKTETPAQSTGDPPPPPP